MKVGGVAIVGEGKTAAGCERIPATLGLDPPVEPAVDWISAFLVWNYLTVVVEGKLHHLQSAGVDALEFFRTMEDLTTHIDNGEPPHDEDLARLPDVEWVCAAAAQGGYEETSLFSLCRVPKRPSMFIAGGADEILRVVEILPEMTGDDVSAEESDDERESFRRTRIVQEFKSFSDSIVKCCLSSDETYLAVAVMDGSISLYSTTGELPLTFLQTITGPQQEIEDLCWSPRGCVVFAVSADGTAWLWHATKGLVHVFTAAGRLTTCEFTESDDGEISVCAGSAQGTITAWDPVTGATKWTVCVEEDSEITAMTVDVQEPVLAVGSSRGKIAIINYVSGKVVSSSRLSVGSIESLAFCPPSHKNILGSWVLAAGDSEGAITLINASTFVTKHVLKIQNKLKEEEEESVLPAVITHVVWIPNDTQKCRILGCDDSGTVK